MKRSVRFILMASKQRALCRRRTALHSVLTGYSRLLARETGWRRTAASGIVNVRKALRRSGLDPRDAAVGDEGVDDRGAVPGPVWPGAALSKSKGAFLVRALAMVPRSWSPRRGAAGGLRPRGSYGSRAGLQARRDIAIPWGRGIDVDPTRKGSDSGYKPLDIDTKKDNARQR